MAQLTLKHFILKQRVINLYRQAVRACRSKSAPHPEVTRHPTFTLATAIPDLQTRKETLVWIRSEFERNRYLSDTVLFNSETLGGILGVTSFAGPDRGQAVRWLP